MKVKKAVNITPFYGTGAGAGTSYCLYPAFNFLILGKMW
jgi:hypothetical protein